ncbi:FAD/NAD(P)-binding domain-containing protein [Annulohypoxylon maeteangense]|uniref:FAD/NAD(P)-binding domain-containing protein n=1 Tax=Annulohypoxylon maeteangense TaxID=1927788 RepID=UPI0020080071|nr:FAD/NAD(P)-binding domain-containing protein [Annulohypoxylon maeteangense]KAI0882449.1 FAD/NAD(P)-binding domain-containing protein [Annulohypoxylon maeteangense]
MTVETLEQTPNTNGATTSLLPQETPDKPTNGVQIPVVKVEDAAKELLKEPKFSSYPVPTLKLEDRYIDEPRQLRVAVIGAGLSGVLAGILLPAKVPNIKLTIFEKNADVGGTWFENIYPGVRCDVPAHVYQTSFSPNTQWSEQFAQGREIREYWQGLARKYDVYQHLKLSQKVEEISWDEKKSVWNVKVHNLSTGETSSQEFDFVLTAIGRFNAWRLPDYPGINEFKGLLRHASNWDPTFDPTGKSVAIIGNGASGIQLTANLQKRVKHLDHYARNKTWVTASFAGDETSITPIPISASLRDSFADPAEYVKFRKELESKYWRGFSSWLKGSELNQKSREEYTELIRKRLAKKPELFENIIPDFSPHCRRLTPGPNYFEAITEDNVEYIQTRIKAFTATGIETVDGKHRAVDAVFCATGANVDLVPPFSIWANGKDLSQLWKRDGEFGFPYSYLGVATPGFPNLGFVHGPHGSGRSGTVPHSVEVQVTFFAKLLRKVAREGIRTVQPARKAADDFVAYSDAFFETTVLSENCSSWYNSGRPGSRIHGLWPGSAAQVTIVLRDPRWEDWEYEYLSESGNRLAWYFGNGRTRREEDLAVDITPYIKDPATVDLRDVHESWWDLP